MVKGDRSEVNSWKKGVVSWLVLCALMVVTSEGALAQKTAKGFVLTSREGGFSVVFPPGFSEPEQTTEAGTGDDDPTISTTTYTTAIERGACLISFTTYQNFVFEAATAEEVLDAARDGGLEGNEEGLEAQEDFTVGSHPARSVIFSSTTDDGEPLYNRFVWIIAPPRLYQIGFVGYDREDLDADDILGYFDSFVFTSKKGKR